MYDELRRAGNLTVRFDIALRIQSAGADTGARCRRSKTAASKYHDEWLSAGKVKIILDGVIETHTAAMLAPYADDPHSGQLFWEPAKYRQAVTELDRAEIQIFTHAIGDRAIRLALDAYERARRRPTTLTMPATASSISKMHQPATFRASASWASLPVSSRCTPIRMTIR